MAGNPEENQWHESLKTIHLRHSYETAASLAHPPSLMTEKHFGVVVSSPSGGSGTVLCLLAAQSGDSPLPQLCPVSSAWALLTAWSWQDCFSTVCNIP